MEWAAIARAIGVRGAIALALAAALGFVIWRADTISAQRDRYQQQSIEKGLKLAVSNQSIALLKKTISDQNAAAERRAAEYEAAKALATKRARQLAEHARESDKRIARLRNLAGQAGDGTCEVPDELRDLAEGL